MSCKVSVRHRLHQHIIVSAGRSLISLLDPMADDGVTRLAYCRCKSRSSSQMQKPLKLTSEKRRESLPAVCCSWLPPKAYADTPSTYQSMPSRASSERVSPAATRSAPLWSLIDRKSTRLNSSH